MNEIVRIQIGKVPFNIEMPASTALESYLQQLQVYLDDAEVYADIEMRIVELLADRGIAADGVIGVNDVEALKAQLGKPQEFKVETDDRATLQPTAARRLFRDPSTGLLGGVASGLAAYLGISIAWVRILWILFAFISFGWAVLIYIILWVVVPPAKTAADKLQMVGKPVTVPAIQQMAQSVSTLTAGREQSIIRFISVALGILLALASIGAIISTGLGANVLLVHDASIEGYYGPIGHEYIYGIAGLLVLSGILLSALFAVLSYASLVRRFSVKTIVVCGMIIILGLTSFFGAFGLTVYKSQLAIRYMTEHNVSKSIALPDNFSQIAKLEVNARPANVRYFVTDKYSITLDSVIDEKRNLPEPKMTITVEGNTLKVVDSAGNACSGLCNERYTLLISGPALSEIRVSNAKDGVSYADSTQGSLDVIVEDGGRFELLRGSTDRLSAVLGMEATLDLSGAAVKDAIIESAGGADVTLGNVQSVTLNGSGTCPADGQTRIGAQSIDKLTLYGKEMPAESGRYSCATVNIQPSAVH
jgi:phage shock protein PspC (stress-responsive transcriptional regulator)